MLSLLVSADACLSAAARLVKEMENATRERAQASERGMAPAIGADGRGTRAANEERGEQKPPASKSSKGLRDVTLRSQNTHPHSLRVASLGENATVGSILSLSTTDAGARVRRWAAPGLVVHVRSVLRALRERVRERARESVQEQHIASRVSGGIGDPEIANQAREAAAVLRDVLEGGIAPVRDVCASEGREEAGLGLSGRGRTGPLPSASHEATGQDAGPFDRRTVQQVGFVQGFTLLLWVGQV